MVILKRTTDPLDVEEESLCGQGVGRMKVHQTKNFALEVTKKESSRRDASMVSSVTSILRRTAGL